MYEWYSQIVNTIIQRVKRLIIVFNLTRTNIQNYIFNMSFPSINKRDVLKKLFPKFVFIKIHNKTKKKIGNHLYDFMIIPKLNAIYL